MNRGSSIMKSYYDCCWDFFNGNLPGQSLSFVPAFILGSLTSIFILIYLYQRQTKLPYNVIFINIFRRIFFLLPTVDHPDNETCKSSSCIRCQKSREFIEKVIRRWEWEELPPISDRLKDAVESLYHFTNTDLEENEEPEKSDQEENDDFQKPTMFYMKLASNPCWDNYEVYQVEKNMLKLNFSIILSEFQKIFEAFQQGDTWGWKLNDISKGHWCMFSLINQGKIVESNCHRCPNTATMISSFPSLIKDCIFGNVAFSVLYPGSKIGPHCGPTNVRLRMHLGLHVPPKCWITINKKKYKWSAGDSFVFDDSYEHSVTYREISKNEKTPRVILMMDLWHPDILKTEKQALLDLFKPIEE